ncbi:MAG: hypothetical protein HIU89_15740 [Proteobacteria bacterium]|nr:hypothetical protein [Pseudomonadota bacterium]
MLPRTTRTATGGSTRFCTDWTTAKLRRSDRGAVLAYVQRLSGYSRAQLTRLVGRWADGQPLVKRYCAPRHAFARRYTAADVALLADVDRALGTLSGPATACVLRCQRDVFGDARFERLGSISVAHLYSLRGSDGYRQQRVVLSKTSEDRAATIGVRRAPVPEGSPGFIRIDSVQGQPRRRQGHLPHRRPRLHHPVAGRGFGADHLRGAHAARHRADAGAVPLSDHRVSREQRTKCKWRKRERRRHSPPPEISTSKRYCIGGRVITRLPCKSI